MNSAKILILEDHPMTLQMLVLALKRMGYVHIQSACSGEQALSLLNQEGHFDVLICDIQMPGIDGLTFLREAAEVGCIAGVIISSAIAPDLRLAIQQLARLTGYQVLGDLGKPFTYDGLKMLMLRYCPMARPRAVIGVDEWPSATEIQSSLLDGEFIPYYQPKLNLQTLEVVGVEVLARWKHPQRGVLSPGVFLDIVQQFGFLDALTVAIARQAFTFWREQELIEELSLSINVSTEQLARPGLPEAVRQLLEAEQFPAKSLILEVTECGLMQAPITSIENLVRLRLMGCGVSIDDFGAGFSSLQRVCDMPCSELKLDMSLTCGLTYNPRSLAAVDSLLSLSRNLDIPLVAEGIETLEQLAMLQTLGCPIGQGYLFSRPLSGPEFIAWLQQHNSVL